MKRSLSAVCCMLLVGLAVASNGNNKNIPDPLLTAGGYTATVPAFVCGGCAEWIQSKLTDVKSLKNISVDQKTREVRFVVKKGAKVKRSDIQAVLDAAAHEMGMGADYTLHDFKAGETTQK